MDADLQKFVERLRAARLMDEPTIAAYLNAESASSPEALARNLVRDERLTEFQARMIYHNRLAGLRLGKYVLLEKIGSGGMGHVYKAMHERLRRTVALKVLPAKWLQDEEAVGRFHREIHLAARVQHPNVVLAYDAEVDRTMHYLAMEFVEGVDLKGYIDSRGPLPVDDALNFIIQAARGLQAAHQTGIVHRDIKPQNLLIDRNSTVKVLDLGLARIETEAVDSEGLTATGAVFGTVDYMSPEQAEESRLADARSDVYSLGCTLYFLLTGQPPYPQGSMMNRLMAHRHKPIPALRDFREDVPEELEAVYRKMMAKQSNDRHQCMGEVIAALSRIERQATIEAKPSVETVEWDPDSVFDELTNSSLDEEMTSADVSVLKPDMSPEEFGPTELLTIAEPPKAARSIVNSLQARRRSQRAGWIVGVGGILLILLVFWLGSAVFQMGTRYGTVVLRFDNEDALGTTVRIDDQPEIPLNDLAELKPWKVPADGRTHTVQVIKPGFEPFTKTFEVTAGKQQEFFVALIPQQNGRQRTRLSSQENWVPADWPTEASSPREIAEWLLNYGCSVFVQTDDGSVVKVGRLDELPSATEELVGVAFVCGTPILPEGSQAKLGIPRSLLIRHTARLRPEIKELLLYPGQPPSSYDQRTLQEAKALRKVQNLTVFRSPFTAADWSEYLAELDSVEKIFIDQVEDERLSATCLESLPAPEKLRSLMMHNCETRELAAFAGRFTSLTRLHFWGLGARGDMAATIAAFPQLREVSLSGNWKLPNPAVIEQWPQTLQQISLDNPTADELPKVIAHQPLAELVLVNAQRVDHQLIRSLHQQCPHVKLVIDEVQIGVDDDPHATVKWLLERGAELQVLTEDANSQTRVQFVNRLEDLPERVTGFDERVTGFDSVTLPDLPKNERRADEFLVQLSRRTPKLTKLSLRNPRAVSLEAGYSLRGLRHFTELKHLAMDDLVLDADTLASLLARLPELSSFEIAGDRVSFDSASFHGLAAPEKLQRLSIACEFDDRFLPQFLPEMTGLKLLVLKSQPLSPTSLRALRQVIPLVSLSVMHVEDVSRQDWELLGELTQIRFLTLGSRDAKLDWSQQLTAVAGFRQLESLTIQALPDQLSLAVLEVCGRMSHLKKLSLSGSQAFTADRLKRLSRDLPGCEICVAGQLVRVAEVNNPPSKKEPDENSARPVR